MLEKIVYLIIFTLFVNSYKKFILSFSFVNGVANVYLTPKFYLTDILLILLLLSGLLLVIRRSTRNILRSFIARKNIIPLALIGCFLFVSFFSSNIPLSIYFLIHLVLYLGLFFCVRRVLSSAEKVYQAALFLTFPVLIVSFFSILQWHYQHYIFGFFPLGEPSFSATYTNSPLVNLLGAVYLRSFGTFPHPNVLGGFLAVSLIWIFNAFLVDLRRNWRDPASIFKFITLLFGLSALFLSFSQGAWAAFILGFILYALIKLLQGSTSRAKAVYLFISLILIILSFSLIYNLPFDSISTRRADLTQVALDLWRNHPLVGVGPGNFVALSTYYWKEPVHNIYLLTLSEAGIVGFFPFLLLLAYSLINSFKRVRSFPLPFVLLVEILFLGLFDHYLVTSSTGSLLFWIVLGMASS